MKIKSLLSLSLLFTLVFARAQDTLEWQKDSLSVIAKKSRKAYESYNYKDAIKYASELIEKGTEYNSVYFEFMGYDLLGSIYTETDDGNQGMLYAEKALEIAKTSKIDSLIAWGSLNLGLIYSRDKNNYEKGIQLFNSSVTINEKLNELDQVYLTYLNLAWTYLDNGLLDETHTALRIAKSISEKVEVDSTDALFIELLFGRYYQAIEDFDRAKEKLEMTALKADNDSISDLAFESYHSLAKVYAETGDYKNAFKSLEKYNHYEEKIFTDKQLKETERARAQFDVKQAQNELVIAIKEKEFSESFTKVMIAAIFILSIAVLGIFLLFKSRKKYVHQLQDKNKELTDAKEKAEKLSKVKTQFLSTVSHELRTPLYGVIGISTILKEDKRLKAYEEDLESLKFSADYLLSLINDFLLINKMDAEAVKLSKTPYKLDTLTNSILRSFDFSLQQNQSKLHLHIDENVPNDLIGDPLRLSQILMNLLGNAVKFTKNGNIWLNISLAQVTESGLYKTYFTIKDDGIGIPKDKQASIFNEFSQIGNENLGYNGTGLGLTIVQKLLKLFNSKISLKSELGVGSEFSFPIDLVQNKTQIDTIGLDDIQMDVLDSQIMNLHHNFQVLIVDDNKINQKITKRILEKHHFKSSLADDGEQAVTMAEINRYDLILMDINMPKMNGMEAASAIRKFNTDVPIIALTAVELDEIHEKIFNSGINDIIHKPYDTKKFLKTILKNLSGVGTDFSKLI